MTARWRRGKIGVELLVDGEKSVTVARNGSEWRAWGDVSFGHHDRQRVIARVHEACHEAGVTVSNAPPSDS